MLVRATRTLSALTARALFFAGLFILVVILHLGLTGVLRAQGVGGGVSLFISGAAILALVLGVVHATEWASERLELAREMQRVRNHLPSGPCCVVWRGAAVAASDEDAMPWELEAPLRVRYPRLARQLAVEGIAVVEFEIAAGGKAKNIVCADIWPSTVFFEAAREALQPAVFRPKHDEHVRFGATYRIPFIFRIEGATTALPEGGRV
ncbi:MAG: TonB family protein [Hyphomonadaceae bacterium]|nr:TonB family protein [Hyphomonadaceae bacterium]